MGRIELMHFDRQSFSTTCRLLGSLSLIVLLCGCGIGEKLAELAPVEGIVKISGKPAANILVQFLPEVKPGDPAPTSTGLTNEAGEFELETADGKLGAVVGSCKVLFVDTTEERAPQGKESPPPRIPSTYTVIGPRTHTIKVQAEQNPKFEFDLMN